RELRRGEVDGDGFEVEGRFLRRGGHGCRSGRSLGLAHPGPLLQGVGPATTSPRPRVKAPALAGPFETAALDTRGPGRRGAPGPRRIRDKVEPHTGRPGHPVGAGPTTGGSHELRGPSPPPRAPCRPGTRRAPRTRS